jgi:hypothetical protein
LAKLSDNLGNKVIFTQNAVSSKIHEITVKIVNVVGIISLGLGLKDKLRQKAFKFESKFSLIRRSSQQRRISHIIKRFQVEYNLKQ